MKNIKQRFAALTIAGAMLSSLTACEDSLVQTKNEEDVCHLTGTIDFENLGHYDILEIQREDSNSTNLYLAKCKYEPWAECDYWDIVGTKTTIANAVIRENTITSNYGQVVRISAFKDFLPFYSEIKKQYTGEEIEEIFEDIKTDYPNYEFDQEKGLTKK